MRKQFWLKILKERGHREVQGADGTLLLKRVFGNAISLKKTVSRTHSGPKFGRRLGCVSYVGAREKVFQNGVLVCVLLRNNFRNGVPSQK
jgi:hypothetical protein